jgi:hypothetical protein
MELGWYGWAVCHGGEVWRHTRLITLAVFLQLAYEVLVLALPALTVLEVVFLEFGWEAVEELAFAGGYARGLKECVRGTGTLAGGDGTY